MESSDPKNVDDKVVSDFGREWAHFDQAQLPHAESLDLFNRYFAIFPWDRIPPDANAVDIGCGSGRWAMHVARRVGTLHCVDPSSAALAVARKNLAAFSNCEFHNADASSIPLADNSLDFGYSLGVLHHIPDTELALRSSVRKLKPGAPFLVYLYYAFDNRPAWFRIIWKVSDILRRGIARFPFPLKVVSAQLIAVGVYWPLARAALIAERCGLSVTNVPLAMYRRKSFYTMRTDALDRFGTRLEKRFSASEIEGMMRSAGLRDVHIGPEAPYWCAVGYRA